ncbi:3-carboxy-cis,cis-muconate cycloisomerase [Actinomadura sp. ATCC 31491]|uniref:3-carboxy-cis,cis-muconate cycloisomerase n=1 Tax=Actinomadura luzonensis TaxID=2805427 RepID=A0ABT0FXM9_9ACTN|nr:3-carboxy-cis,cis-muconate cycloisomerase [Actinomadura luzonensis]MCK2216918.1 3-carboxy-cis,cis-muconate cycloisomerase [Actinomadura luzonensis]
MTSGDPEADLGLLSPMRGAAAETGDVAVLRALLDAEVALTRAQAALGAAPAEAAGAVAEAARVAAFDLPGLAARARSGGNPVIPLVADLRAAAGPHGAYVHRGATSQDIMDTALMLVAHRTLGPVLADLDRVARALAGLAAAHRDTVMAARTLTQQAVPTTFGLKAAGWRRLVLDARDRLRAARDALPVQLGGAAGTLAAFQDDLPGPGGNGGGGGALRLVARFAAELGLAEPALPWHVLRTPVADLAGALAFASGALGKPAADVLVLSRTEVGELSEGVGGGSSSMPHKRNPVRATMIAAAARQVPPLAAVLYASLAAEDERPPGAWHAEWQPLRECLRVVAGAARDAAELVEGLRVHPERMRANLTLSGSTGAARALVERAIEED